MFNSQGVSNMARADWISIARKTNHWLMVRVLETSNTKKTNRQSMSEYLEREPVGLITQGRLTISRWSEYLGLESVGLESQRRLTVGRWLKYLGSKPVGLLELDYYLGQGRFVAGIYASSWLWMVVDCTSTFSPLFPLYSSNPMLHWRRTRAWV
ncbi:hypothetical protein AMTR_s00144p00099490 [Amborella trichopoda]|uniref:Uncharacterized protein n=1 Tax=Amborella trichopoda TaxID=13333 RepID=W1P700_AMBTC|nr:hypothetical protein AMTR_s00144p00099490 [Amborella trichopoda]